MAAVVEDHLDGLGLLGGELFALEHQQLGESLDGGERAAQLVRRCQHELVFHPIELVAFAFAALKLFGHVVEGGPERRGLGEAADPYPGVEVAGRQAFRGGDQVVERPSHRGDQAAEEERRAGQAGDQAGADQQRRVARLVVDFVAQDLTVVVLGEDLPAGRDGVFSLSQLGARLDLELVGAGGGVLEVLPLLDESRHPDHGEAGQDCKRDREADRQPVSQRRTESWASSGICFGADGRRGYRHRPRRRHDRRRGNRPGRRRGLVQRRTSRASSSRSPSIGSRAATRT